jgi:hypothetical protein
MHSSAVALKYTDFKARPPTITRPDVKGYVGLHLSVPRVCLPPPPCPSPRRRSRRPGVSSCCGSPPWNFFGVHFISRLARDAARWNGSDWCYAPDIVCPSRLKHLDHQFKAPFKLTVGTWSRARRTIARPDPRWRGPQSRTRGELGNFSISIAYQIGRGLRGRRIAMDPRNGPDRAERSARSKDRVANEMILGAQPIATNVNSWRQAEEKGIGRRIIPAFYRGPVFWKSSRNRRNRPCGRWIAIEFSARLPRRKDLPSRFLAANGPPFGGSAMFLLNDLR